VKTNRKRKIILEDSDEDQRVVASSKQRKPVQKSSSPVESTSVFYTIVFKKNMLTILRRPCKEAATVDGRNGR
jgi:hypothetical protein